MAGVHLDRYVMLPVVNVYRDYIPFFLRLGIDNFFSNVASFNHTVNSALQLNGETTVNNGLRFISNTTMGIGGLFDIATGMGFPEIKEDFGQTMGYLGAAIVTLLHLLVQLAFIVRVLIRPHRQPASRITWVVVILALPLFAMLVYLFFGEVNIGRRRIA